MAGRTLVLGIGNLLLTDDGVGIVVSRRVRELVRPHEPIDVTETEMGGLALIDLCEGYERLVVVDAARLDGLGPGDVVVLGEAETRPTLHLVSGHEVDLPTALELGRHAGVSMPAEVTYVAVGVEDIATFSEGLTPLVAEAVDLAARAALGHARGDAGVDPPEPSAYAAP